MRLTLAGCTAVRRVFQAAFLAVGSALLVVGCASSPQSKPVNRLTAAEASRTLLVESDRTVRGTCSISLNDAPPFAELADSAAVHRDIAEAWTSSGAQPGRAVLSVSIDSLGHRRWSEVLESDLPDALHPTLVEALDGRLRTRTREDDDGESRRAGWMYRLGIDAGPEPRFMTGHGIGCPPALQNERAIARTAAAQARSVPIIGEPVSYMWIQVSPDGHPAEIRVHRSSGHVQLDRIATNSVTQAVFEPGSFDGIPITMWVAMPITFRTADDER